MIAGLEEITSGELWFDDQMVNDRPPHRRDVAMVFQSYALYPHKTVYENIAFGLRMRRVSGAEVDRRVRDAAAKLAITRLLQRRPSQLSGGQRQRVALGRAMVRQPSVFLMDEPLSNLDAALRISTRAEIKQLHTQMQTTFVYVTHDQAEALTLADRIVVMKMTASCSKSAHRTKSMNSPQICSWPHSWAIRRSITSRANWCGAARNCISGTAN